MPRTCPSCGRVVEATVRGLCPECFSRVYGVARLPSRVEARICRYCGRVWLGGRWRRASSFREAVDLVLGYEASRARPVEPLEEARLAEVYHVTQPNWTTRTLVRLVGRHGGATVEGSLEVVVSLRPSICPLCKTRISGEYDTLLQIHGAPSWLEGEVLEAIWRLGLEHQVVDIDWGRDVLRIYLTNRGAASKLVKEVSRRLPVERLGEAHEEVGLDSSGRRRTRRVINIRVSRGKS